MIPTLKLARFATPRTHRQSGAAHPSRLLPTWTMIMPNSGKPEFGRRSRNDGGWSVELFAYESCSICEARFNHAMQEGLLFANSAVLSLDALLPSLTRSMLSEAVDTIVPE